MNMDTSTNYWLLRTNQITLGREKAKANELGRLHELLLRSSNG